MKNKLKCIFGIHDLVVTDSRFSDLLGTMIKEAECKHCGLIKHYEWRNHTGFEVTFKERMKYKDISCKDCRCKWIHKESFKIYNFFNGLTHKNICVKCGNIGWWRRS